MVAVYFSFGLAIGLMAPLVDEISDDLGLSRSEMGSVLGAWALIYIVTAVPGGVLVDRLGLRLAMSLGSVSIAASLVLRATATGRTSLFLAVAVFGIGGPLVSISTPKLVASLFEDDARRLPTGLAVASPGIGSAVGFALPNPVLLPMFDQSWRAVIHLAGAVALTAGIYWLLATRSSLGGTPSAAPMTAGTYQRLLRLSTIRWILFIAVFSFAFSHGANGWLPELLADAGIGDDAAGYLTAASTMLGIVGSLTVARLVPAEKRGGGLVVIFVGVSACAIGLATLDTTGAAVVVLALGFIRAGSLPLIFLTMMDDPDIAVADMGAATGLFFAFAEIGGFGGPWSLGVVADGPAGFTGAALALGVFAALGAIGATGLWRRRPTDT